MADILNATFDFSRAKPDHVAAFRGTPRRVLFQPGDKLYRFTSIPAGSFPGNELFNSPWWLPADTFHTLTRIAGRTASPLVDTARSRLAVTRDWNPTLEWLAIIELTRSAYGWVGTIRPQPETHGHRSVLLMGNLDQAYVPGLGDGAAGQSSPYAFLSYYGSVT
jgi:hypothetical protein